MLYTRSRPRMVNKYAASPRRTRAGVKPHDRPAERVYTAGITRGTLMDTAAISRRTLDSTSKGIPGPGTVTPATVASKNWNLLSDDLHFPTMVLLDSVVEHNLRTMMKWCAANGFLFSPHGKTTMCPQLYDRQVKAGAWGITVASAQQALVGIKYGLKRIFIANQLVGRANIRSIALAMNDDPALEVHCCADSVESVTHLAGHWKEAGAKRPIRVLL